MNQEIILFHSSLYKFCIPFDAIRKTRKLFDTSISNTCDKINGIAEEYAQYFLFKHIDACNLNEQKLAKSN